MKTVINVCKDEIKFLVRERYRNQIKYAQQNELVSSNKSDLAEIRKRLIAAIHLLPEHFRIPIWLTHYENMSVKEVSVCLGKPEKTVRTQLTRGLEKLHNMLKGQSDEFTTVNIIAILFECKKNEIVPYSMLEKISTIINIKDSIKFFPKINDIKNIYVSYLKIAFAFVLFGIVSWQIIRKNKNENYSINFKNDFLPVNNKNNSDLFFDFNSDKIPDWCIIKSTNVKLVVTDSDHGQILKFSDNDIFSLYLNISTVKKPFKISYEFKPEKLGFSVFPPIEQSNNLYTFNIDPSNNIVPQNWNRIEMYVQDNATSIWFNGKLKLIHVSLDDESFKISIKFAKLIGYIDNIKVVHIEDNNYLDLSNFIKMANQLPINTFVGETVMDSPVPELIKDKINVKWHRTKYH